MPEPKESHTEQADTSEVGPLVSAIDMLYHCQFNEVLTLEKQADFYDSLWAAVGKSEIGELFIQLYFVEDEAELAQDNGHINYAALHYNFVYREDEEGLMVECTGVLVPEDGRADITHDPEYANTPFIILQPQDINLAAAAKHEPHH